MLGNFFKLTAKTIITDTGLQEHAKLKKYGSFEYGDRKILRSK